MSTSGGMAFPAVMSGVAAGYGAWFLMHSAWGALIVGVIVAWAVFWGINRQLPKS